MYSNWITLLYTWNIGSQLYFNKKKKKKKQPETKTEEPKP